MTLFLDTASRASFIQRADASTSRIAQAAVESDESTPDVRQTLGAALKKTGEAAHAFGSALSTRFDEARKNSAREQVSQVHQRIQMLKRMILLFGGSKALLRELKQLAGTLATAAKVLNEGGNGMNTPTFTYSETGTLPSQPGMPTDSPDTSSMPESNEQQQAQTLTAQVQQELADQQASAEEENEDEEAPHPQPTSFDAQPPAGSRQSQRHSDAKLLAEALRELKALVAAAKAAQRKPDREDQKDLSKIDRDLKQVEQSISSLNATTAPMPGSLSIHA